MSPSLGPPWSGRIRPESGVGCVGSDRAMQVDSRDRGRRRTARPRSRAAREKRCGRGDGTGDAQAGQARIRGARAGDHGDREPDPGLLLRPGRHFLNEPALARVEQAVAEGAAIIDIGGAKAGPGDEVSAAEEARRTVGLPSRRSGVGLPGRRDQRGHLAARGRRGRVRGGRGPAERRVGRRRPPKLAEVAALGTGAGLVCTHAGGARAADPAAPGGATTTSWRTSPLQVTVGLTERAAGAGACRGRRC